MAIADPVHSYVVHLETPMTVVFHAIHYDQEQCMPNSQLEWASASSSSSSSSSSKEICNGLFSNLDSNSSTSFREGNFGSNGARFAGDFCDSFRCHRTDFTNGITSSTVLPKVDQSGSNRTVTTEFCESLSSSDSKLRPTGAVDVSETDTCVGSGKADPTSSSTIGPRGRSKTSPLTRSSSTPGNLPHLRSTSPVFPPRKNKPAELLKLFQSSQTKARVKGTSLSPSLDFTKIATKQRTVGDLNHRNGSSVTHQLSERVNEVNVKKFETLRMLNDSNISLMSFCSAGGNGSCGSCNKISASHLSHNGSCSWNSDFGSNPNCHGLIPTRNCFENSLGQLLTSLGELTVYNNAINVAAGAANCDTNKCPRAGYICGSVREAILPGASDLTVNSLAHHCDTEHTDSDTLHRAAPAPAPTPAAQHMCIHDGYITFNDSNFTADVENEPYVNNSIGVIDLNTKSNISEARAPEAIIQEPHECQKECDKSVGEIAQFTRMGFTKLAEWEETGKFLHCTLDDSREEDEIRDDNTVDVLKTDCRVCFVDGDAMCVGIVDRSCCSSPQSNEDFKFRDYSEFMATANSESCSECDSIDYESYSNPVDDDDDDDDDDRIRQDLRPDLSSESEQQQRQRSMSSSGNSDDDNCDERTLPRFVSFLSISPTTHDPQRHQDSSSLSGDEDLVKRGRDSLDDQFESDEMDMTEFTLSALQDRKNSLAMNEVIAVTDRLSLHVSQSQGSMKFSDIPACSNSGTVDLQIGTRRV